LAAVLKRTSLAALLGVVVSAMPARAQIAFDPNRNQAIGATAGLASGAGVSYQEILPTAWGFRGALFGWNLGDSSFIDIGASGLRILSDDGNRRIYLIGGTSFWRWSDEETVPELDDQGNVIGERKLTDTKESWGIGVGVGLEMPLATRTTFAIEGLFTYWSRSEAFLPLPQISIHYQF
jgi:hypothetical protein